MSYLLLLILVAGIAAACGDAVTSEPSPEVVETAEAESRDVTIVAPASTTPESGDNGEEPVTLDGRVFGHGETGVILAHMRPADQTSWYPFAQVLADTGDYTVMTFNFRGYGDCRSSFVLPSCSIPKKRLASCALCARHRSSILAAVAAPPAA